MTSLAFELGAYELPPLVALSRDSLARMRGRVREGAASSNHYERGTL